jgi:hypothetical protein
VKQKLFRSTITNLMEKTLKQYDSVIAQCRKVFELKTRDYGTSWRILRVPSLTDQIFIKANRIRSIDNKATIMVDEGIEPEFIGILNYSIMALIQLELGTEHFYELDTTIAMQLYDKYVKEAKELMSRKNHDYGEAWRSMRISSITDIILMRLLRIKQIEDNEGRTSVSEGIDANYFDILNYAAFVLIKLNEEKNPVFGIE